MEIFTKKRILILISLLFVFYILNAFFNAPIKNFFYSKSEALQAALWKSGGQSAFERKNQALLNQQLTAQNQALTSQLAELEATKQENDTLREALGLQSGKQFELIMGEAIGKDIAKDSLLINIGSKDGVVKGFPVVLSSKILLGKVIDVYDNFSRVSLISAKDNLIDVEIPDSSVSALSRGQGGLKLSLEMIPKDKQVNVGSLILTSAMGGNYPSGLVMGKIKSVENLDSEPSQKAEVELPFDLSTIGDIFVIKDAQIIIQ